MSKTNFYLFNIDTEKNDLKKFEPSETKFKNKNKQCVEYEEEKKLSIKDISIKYNDQYEIVYLKSDKYYVYKDYKFYRNYEKLENESLSNVREKIQIDTDYQFLLEKYCVEIKYEKDTELSKILFNDN